MADAPSMPGPQRQQRHARSLPLTDEEVALLDAAARLAGYGAWSDWLRDVGLDRARALAAGGGRGPRQRLLRTRSEDPLPDDILAVANLSEDQALRLCLELDECGLHFGVVLTRLREAVSLGRDDVARHAGCPISLVKMVEEGKLQSLVGPTRPGLNELAAEYAPIARALAQALGVRSALVRAGFGYGFLRAVDGEGPEVVVRPHEAPFDAVSRVVRARLHAAGWLNT